jgi:hypothetical protein
MNNISDPLERIRHTNERAIESGENCQSVFVSLKGGQEASFYYSYLRANRRDGERLMLMHVSAMIAISGPSELLAEAHRLVSQQRLAGVRDGEEGLVVEIDWTEAVND